jgi:hypothetical protein
MWEGVDRIVAEEGCGGGRIAGWGVWIRRRAKLEEFVLGWHIGQINESSRYGLLVEVKAHLLPWPSNQPSLLSPRQSLADFVDMH